jgi:hypothetical protein
LDPVTIATRPAWSGIWSRLQVVMSNNVDNANKDVNDNFLRYAASP